MIFSLLKFIIIYFLFFSLSLKYLFHLHLNNSIGKTFNYTLIILFIKWKQTKYFNKNFRQHETKEKKLKSWFKYFYPINFLSIRSNCARKREKWEKTKSPRNICPFFENVIYRAEKKVEKSSERADFTKKRTTIVSLCIRIRVKRLRYSSLRKWTRR